MGGLMRLLSLFAGTAFGLCALTAPAGAKPPMEAFGDLPGIRSMELSPDGKKVAFLQRVNGDDVLAVHDLATSTTKGLTRVGDIRARYVHFVGNDYVVLVASKDTRTVGYRGRYEFSAAFSFNLTTGKSAQLLRGTSDIFPAQSGLGRILGVEQSGKYVLMPAFMGAYDPDPAFDLLRVPLDSGRGGRLDGGRGTSNTIDWLVNTSGRIIVREDFNEKNQFHQVRARQPNGDWKAIYEKETPLPEISVVGASKDSKSLFLIDDNEAARLSLYTMSIDDGTMTGPVLQRDDAEVANVITDINRTVHGVLYSGMFPRYDMFDEGVEADINAVMNALPGSAVYLDSWSDDWSKLLFFAEGGWQAERYYLYDRAAKSLSMISQARPELKPEDVGEVSTVEFKARDGLKIPSLITWPANVAQENRKNLPLVVMPHGGPEAYDSVGFDWLAQYLANEGFAVLQPNFRGSAGFGQEFVIAGYGQWGRKMQDDITDGANALVKMGWVDPQRICIVGWSYGGYAALAGGASTPDLYKCVASIAGVSHLREMLANERKEHGPFSRTVTYWEALIGDPDKDRDAIDAVSPALHADKFKAPVLLIHGASDLIVPIRQSEMMNDALKNAGKPVQYIRIEGDDHSLVEDASRRKVLTALGEFLAKHIGPR
jgi:dipeptidyl aminopeptidase/acylaminoacyl peptidase